MVFRCEVTEGGIDVASAHLALSRISPAVGAVVLFTGQVRDVPLELEAHPALVRRQINALWTDACARWPLAGGIVIHRHGRLAVGETIVLVGTASAHRAEAFAAAEFLMDWLKVRAAFWKKEGDQWVAPRDSDARAAARWIDVTPSG
jgi:molybdopterin synthase catalytic subunit